MNDTMDVHVAFENKSVETLMLISVFGEIPYRHRAQQELRKNRLVYCNEEFGDDFLTNLDLIF